MRPLRATDTELLGPLCEDDMGQKWLGPHENVQQQAQLAVQPSIELDVARRCSVHSSDVDVAVCGSVFGTHERA